uniref:Piwi-like protein 2 n=1 Tax=Schmidtea mediterranea TaxID=79327 RepID=PIWI2_SCHMD|nr:RecName: Full=Piwi-like protein 2; AltName: Full=SMEDWI-2 [Schmidtea mediterranea]ABB77338.1 PIWI-like protein 2 [Schmidtea mediterranea]
MEEIPVKVAKLEANGSETRGKMGNRGGLRGTFRIVEPNLQPADITEKTGNIGRTVKLQSNFTKFSVLRSEKFMMYDSVFSQVGLSPKVKLQFIVRVCQENKLPGAFCFDGRRLFTSEKWHGESDIQEFSHDEKKMTLRLVSTILPETEEYYQMINVLLNNLQVMLGQERIGKGYFLSPNITKDEVPRNSGPTFFETNSFKVLGGFGTTLQRGTKPTGELTTLLYIERINRVLNDNSVMKAYNRRSIDQLIGRDIITKYNNKTYRISEIKEMNVDEKFEMGGRTLSYAEYFKERYNIRLTQGDQPFVLTRVKKPMRRERKKKDEEGVEKEKEKEAPEEKDMTLNIPGELCFLCGFSDQEKSNMDLQKNLGCVLKREPRERLDDIPAYCNWIKNSDAATGMCNKWQLKIDNKPLEIEGRELPPCDVISGGSKINEKMGDDWKFGRVQFDIKRDRKHEIDVVIVDRNDFQYKNFMNDVEQELRNMRIDARVGKVNTCGPNDVERCLNDAARSGSGCAKMALVFVPDDRVYAKVKSFTMSTGLLTQCVTTRNGTNRNDKRRKVVSSKTVMQIFAKFGYDPWTVEIKLRPTMIVGMDTYHNKSSKKSIQASVFSINSTFTQYMSFVVNSPKGRQEFHETLGKNFNLALEDFKKRYDILPQRILVFRDGVGDNQLQFTKNFEVDAMKPLIENIYKGNGFPVPQIIYVIVKKRVGTKLFNRGNNPNPGTVVDKEIVKPNFYEFFLVSQRTTKGTATPTNYNVLEDTRLLTKKGTMDPMAPNELQKITYALTHLYFNWMGTIRVPVPVHYAHRLAELVGKVHKGSNPVAINERIRNRLFYL